jgi:iron complex outermembrane receptor protein
VKFQSSLKGAVAPIALSIALVSQPAFAQGEVPADDSEEAEDNSSDGSPIIVTGSRIRRDEFSAPAPITVVDPEIAVRQGLMDTGEMIQGSPIAAGSDQITSALSSNFVTNGGAGAQTISLRGLGAERTLVLLNGRRAGPAGSRGAVSAFDLNVLPQSIVEQVDILKDGASSIYGSDAVAGVVNLITKTDTDGIQLDVFGSLPESDGAENYSIAATWGKSFDRGHFLVSAVYQRRNELTRGDRDYLRCPENYVFTDETYSTRADLIDPRTGTYSCQGQSDITWGHVWTYDGSAFGSPLGSNLQGSAGVFDVTLLQYDYAGDNLGQYIPPIGPKLSAGQIGAPDGWYAVGYDGPSTAVQNNYHPFMDHDTIIPQTDRYTLYVDAAYELTDDIELYTELLYNKRKTYVNASRQIWGFGYGETFDYFYDYNYNYEIDGPEEGVFYGGDPFATGWSGYAVFSPTAITDQFDSWQEIDYYRGVLGLRGDIGSNWQWDIYGQYSKSDATYAQQQTLSDSIDYIYYRFASCEGLTTPVGGKPCVDVNIFDPYFLRGELTEAQKNYFFDWDIGTTDYTQWYVEAIVTGDAFELPAGPVGVALGVNFRRDEINDSPGPITQAGNAWGVTTAGVTAGRTDTKEAFAEVSIPLLGDIPGIQALNLSAAGRLTNVTATRAADGQSDTDNGNFTYKLGLDWEVNDWLRFRGTYGTSFRAPALFEQFLADQTSSLGQRDIDPCIQWGVLPDVPIQLQNNCAADGVPFNHTGAGISATVYTGGQVGRLNPETSTAWTASMILTPTFDFAPNTRFSLALDYFDIEVNDEITQLGTSLLAGCYYSDDFPDDPLCDLFARNQDLSPDDPDYNPGYPANVAFVKDDFLNVASQRNRGIDATIRVIHDFGGDTSLTFQSQMTWQMEDKTALFAGFFEDNNGEAGDPIWVGDFNLQLDTGPWTVFYGLDVIGATDDREDWVDGNGTLCPTYVSLGTVCLDLTTDATFYHSVSVTREINDMFTLTAGVANLTDQKPPRVSDFNGNGARMMGQGLFYSQYDLIGRRYFVNFSAKL